jgi:hypothetical protein
MKEQFCIYEIAKAFKELGFDEPCMAYYRDGKITGVNKWNRNDWEFHSISLKEITCVTSEIILAPLWQQCIDWLRTNHSLHIDIGYIDDIAGYAYVITNIENNEELCELNYKTYENTRKEGILKAIELITKI